MRRKDRLREQRKQKFVTWFLVFLMVFSVAGILIGSTGGGGAGDSLTGDLDYEGQDFESNGGYYVTKVSGQEKRLYFHPLDLLRVDIPEEAVSSVEQSPVLIITFDPDAEDIESMEVARFQLATNLGKNTYSAVTEESDVYAYPVVTCDNATSQQPVIQLKGSNRSTVGYEDGCIMIEGSGLDLIKGAERLMYEVMGVMDEE